jgi:phage gp29-like protein
MAKVDSKIVDRRGIPFKIERERRSTRRELRDEIGSGGVSFFEGLIDNDEENAKLTGMAGVETFDKMRRTDAQIGAVLNAVSLPIISADWSVGLPEEQKQAEAISEEHLRFAQDNLFTNINFSDFLRHALSSIWAGFSWFEKVYEAQDGFLPLKKISPRLATTVNKWWTDDRGELIGIEQEVFQQGHCVRVDIPRDKIALFSFQKEANNFEGQSLLRQIYKHWLIKDQMYRIDAIRAERFGVGVPIIKLPEEFNEKQQDQAETLGKNWRSAEQAFGVISGEMDVQIVQGNSGDAFDLIPSIKHHNEEIAKVILAQFINFGTTGQSGNRALGQAMQEFFIDALYMGHDYPQPQGTYQAVR